jgi:GAF domain-containing protein
MDSHLTFKKLADFGRALLTKPTLSEGLPIISEYAKGVSGAQRCSIFIRNTANKTLWTTLADETDPITLHENDGIAGHTIKEGKPLLINDPYHDEHFLPSIDDKTGFITENIASIPIFDSGRRIIGVFQLLNKPDGFSVEDSKSMIFFAHYISTYLELAISFDNQGSLLKKEPHGH